VERINFWSVYPCRSAGVFICYAAPHHPSTKIFLLTQQGIRFAGSRGSKQAHVKQGAIALCAVPAGSNRAPSQTVGRILAVFLAALEFWRDGVD
jgi:hypothetical protein